MKLVFVCAFIIICLLYIMYNFIVEYYILHFHEGTYIAMKLVFVCAFIILCSCNATSLCLCFYNTLALVCTKLHYLATSTMRVL